MAEGRSNGQASATIGVRLALLAMVTYFGGSLPAYKFASESFGPATTNLIRFVIATAFLLILARNKLGSASEHKQRLFLIGMFGIGLMALFLGAGVDEGSATIGSIIVGLEPIGVALAGTLIVGDRPTRRTIIALILGVIGAVVASGILTLGGQNAAVLPIVLLVGTVITFAVYTALVRRAAQGVDALAVASLTQLGALAFVIPACLFDVANGGMIRNAGVTPKAVWAAIFLGFGSAIAYWLLCSVLATQPPSRVAVSMYLTPVLGVLFSWWIVGEALHLRHAVAAAIVLLAIWISESGQTARA
jgi:drug/metabolite transporter, DME family